MGCLGQFHEDSLLWVLHSWAQLGFMDVNHGQKALYKLFLTNGINGSSLPLGFTPVAISGGVSAYHGIPSAVREPWHGTHGPKQCSRCVPPVLQAVTMSCPK